eukprot:Nitzschia sp. Nitz4//scaffold74_size92883//40052//40999//NITZ4_004824-RA/size92883-snap-gene-0.155-mRNA-1//1//CDS//3329557598//7775//frame0
MYDSAFFMPKGSTLKGNVESGYIMSKIAFLRDPVKHIVSQYLECKYDPFFRDAAINSGFPGITDLDDALKGLDEWVQHFVDGGTDIGLSDSRFAFHCYDPWNMQSRYFTSTSLQREGPHTATFKSDRKPELSTAIQHMEQIDVLGMTEYFGASLCLFQFHAFGSRQLLEACHYCDVESKSLRHVEEKMHRFVHYSPEYNMNDVPDQALTNIRETLTTVDHELYQAGLERFFKDVDRVRLVTGVDLLCRGNTTNPNSTASYPPPLIILSVEVKELYPTFPIWMVMIALFFLNLLRFQPKSLLAKR